MSVLVAYGELMSSLISVNQGELMLSLRRMPELTPFAQVVVYTVLPDGEAVADSQDFPIQLCLKNKVGN